MQVTTTQDGQGQETSRAFELTEFFAGSVQASGLFEDRFGSVRRRFCVAMDGQFADGVFVLTEDFIYDDGECQQRVWRVVPGQAGAFTATAADIVGTAHGVAASHTITMVYRHEVMIEGRGVVLSFHDRIHRVDEVTAFSRAVVTKWGFKVGEVTICFRKVAARAFVADGEAGEREAA